MKRILLSEGAEIRPNKNTKSEYDSEISYDVLENRLRMLEKAIPTLQNSVIYISGMGAHPKSTYKELGDQPNCRVIFYKSVLPRALRFLNLFASSYSGLLKLYSIEILSETFLKVVDRSMAAIYVFPEEYEKDFLLNVENNISTDKLESGIKSNSSYLIYMVDADNPESSTGIYEIVSYGKGADGIETAL